MRAYVYTDKGLERYAGRFVWLSVNTENSKNAEFLTKYKIAALPTLLVLEPRKDTILLRYVGGATIGQLARMLDDVKRRSGSSSDSLLIAADRLSAEGKPKEAAPVYEQALQEASRGWRKYGRTAESLLFALTSSNQNEVCAQRALELYPKLKGTVSGASVASYGLSCATELEEKNPNRAKLIDAFEKPARQALDDPKLELSADDRSGLYIALIGARDAMKDEPGSNRLKQEWVAFLEKAASEAKTPEQRAVYDSHRLSAYIETGAPEKAIPMLEQSRRDFPDDYNPLYRLAVAYKAMKQYDKALQMTDEAMPKLYGPRKILAYRLRADILTAKGDKEGARKTIAEAVDYAKSLPVGQRNDRTIASLKKRLTEIAQ